jgi:hypothetical protein
VAGFFGPVQRDKAALPANIGQLDRRRIAIKSTFTAHLNELTTVMGCLIVRFVLIEACDRPRLSTSVTGEMPLPASNNGDTVH